MRLNKYAEEALLENHLETLKAEQQAGDLLLFRYGNQTIKEIREKIAGEIKKFENDTFIEVQT